VTDETDPSASSIVPRLIVGIGASAGGIVALREFFGRAPANAGIAYVVILHLSPEHESRLAEGLKRPYAIQPIVRRLAACVGPFHTLSDRAG
jgi:chemotaxis response regulator CheB